MKNNSPRPSLSRRKFLSGSLAAGALALAGIFSGRNNLLAASNPGALRWQITIDGKIVREGAVLPDRTEEVLIPVKNGAARVVLDHGRIYLPEDNTICPKKICSLMGSITRPGERITCLPNKLVVRIVQAYG